MYMLRQLVAIADCGTISKAAQELHLSQPALSRTVTKLEDVLGVTLFDRGKNKIALNQNGQLAVGYARKVLQDAELLVDQVRAFDESQRTISVCSCAPSPLWILIPALSERYPNMKIASEMKYHEGFADELILNHCHILVTPAPIDDPDVICRKFLEENLLLSVPPAHPLAGCEAVTLADLGGETMLLYSDLGFWHEMHRKKTPDTTYIMQSEYGAMTELVRASALPSYVSDVVMQEHEYPANRVTIPITDPEAHATFYCCWRRADQKRFAALDEYLKSRI